MKVVLASGSPRRQKLLKEIFNDFSIVVPDIEEILPEGMTPESGPEYLAEKKASNIHRKMTDCLVIGADTGVIIDNMMLGKPDSVTQARSMILRLSGRKHKVITGCCVIYKEKKIVFSEESIVEFRKISESELTRYLSTEEPYDKAGGYGIQGKGKNFVKSIEGDYNNIVGLPVLRLEKVIKYGIIPDE